MLLYDISLKYYRYRSPTSLSSALAPPFNQKVGHVLVQFAVRSTHPDTMITAERR
jgi:hypothetical protein